MNTFIRKTWSKHATVIVTYLVAAFLLLFVSIMRPGYADINNIRVLSIFAAILGFTVLGQTVVILTGGMDLSIPWMFTLSSFLMASMSKGSNAALIYTIPVVLIVGILMGVINGVGIAYVGIAPVIMTMATNIIYQGLLVGISGGMPGGAAPDFIKFVATGDVGGISILFLLWLAISGIALLLLNRTAYGRKIYAVGSNEKVALFSGINVKLIKVSAYAICGFMSALAGMLYAGRLGQLYLGMGDEYQMESIAAVAIGGVSLIGGRGSYAGAMAGVFILIILNGLLSAMNIPQSIQKIIYGVVLFLAVLISSNKIEKRKKA
jgi:ribose transport system permease protein